MDFSPELRQSLLQTVGRVCRRFRTRSFLVGGPVRDQLLGRQSPDIDIAVEAGMPKVGEALARALGGRFVYHSRFMTGTIMKPVAFSSTCAHVDIAQTRSEVYTRPAALPIVRPAGIEEDLARRDFTVNAMALELTPGAFGRLIDPLGGQSDLNRRIVRVLHERSFVDDPTRIFRALRFTVRLGAHIDPQTRELMRLAIVDRVASLLSPERVLNELRLFCQERHAGLLFKRLLSEKVLESVWSWQAPARLLPGLLSLVRRRADPQMLFVFLLSCLPVTERFPIQKAQRAAAAATAAFERIRPAVIRCRRMSSLHRLLKSFPDLALKVLAITEPCPLGRKLGRYLSARQKSMPLISECELRAMGLEPGRAYGRLLDLLSAARMDGRIRNREEELKFARRYCQRTKRQ